MTSLSITQNKPNFSEKQRQKDLEETVMHELSGTRLYEKIAFLKTQKGNDSLLKYEDFETNLNNQQIKKIVVNKKSELFSNCFSTLIFSLSAEEKIKSLWKYLKEVTLNEIIREENTFTDKKFLKKLDKTDRIYLFPLNITSDNNSYFRPGYVGFGFMSEFMRTCVIEADKKNAIGGIVKFSSLVDIKDKYFQPFYLLEHCAVYLGEENEKDIIFHQEGFGKRFCFATIQDYISNQPMKKFNKTNEPYYQVKYYKLLN